MAKAFACLVFILVILSNLVFHSQGRNLNGGGAKYGKNVPINPNELGQHRVRLDEEYPDAFRPTSPGHSPGIGHSLRGQRVKLDDEGSTSAFRPTSPGHSPGIGHSKHD
ncbi:hypothetical protein PHJA_001837300 [Phtheirospermum japonicum]|uniref:Uncharacterized protein n=1 Tax=Phtheirospermum japonicum TaxID=374723 RepID=A0A830CF52_9LAMI|nr:hypothetical protein PHJA_001837300 [Phtheirospermum japonicum]